MLQLDGSEHRWVEHLPKFVILAAIDDATGKLWVVIRPTEDLQGYMELLEKVCTTAGVPGIAYTDGFSSFGTKRRGRQGQKERETAQLKRLLRQLGIQHITARSAPAKGRVERSFNTLQDRLIAHLRADEVRTMDDVVRSIGMYVMSHNLRFTVPPARPPAWRPWPSHLSPAEVFCRHETRVVRNDSTITFYGKVIDLPAAPDGASRARQQIDVLTGFDGTITVKHGAERLALILPRKAPKPRPQPKSAAGQRTVSQNH